MKSYDHKAIEGKWRTKWEKDALYQTVAGDVGKEKCYVLDMFPYPSGAGLHVGHPKGYIATDVYARHKRMQGYSVLHPMGWDAFGLPAENYALKNKVHPNVAVRENVARFKEQLEKIGFDYDWEREINTTDPNFYKWTQWAFVQMFKKGLAYESYEPINWCPSCKTGLANEDLDGDRCERCDSIIEKKPMRQWVLRITDYADRLLQDLDALPWAEHVKEAQRNWIGRSNGALLEFRVTSSEARVVGNEGRAASSESKHDGKKPKVLIIHGFAGDPSVGWKPWLKESLEAIGYEVRSPKMPHFDHPDYAECMEFLETQVADFSESDIVVGHSLGGHFALKLAERHNFSKVVLVAPTIGGFNFPYEDWKRNDPDLDFDSCKKILEEQPAQLDAIKAAQKIAIFGEIDRGIPVAHAGKLDSSWTVIKKADTGHMSREKEVPEILEAVVTTNSKLKTLDSKLIEVFTTRPDTLYGATYVVLAPEHKLVAELLENGPITNVSEVRTYIDEAGKKTEIDRTAEGKEKTGVKLEGVTALNPANGEELPIFIADYVLAGYGTGAIMAVPAHDERDFAFAKKFALPIRSVIVPSALLTHVVTVPEDISAGSQRDARTIVLEGGCWTREGELVDSGPFTGMSSENAKAKITEHAGGKMTTKYRLQDWVFSRQRYWGEPIPIIHCEKCGAVPVPEADLPVRLPDVESYEPTGTGESPLANIAEWVNTTCPTCGGLGKRETNTMPQWAGSSWYYLRYIDPTNDAALVDPKKEKYWSPVDVYVGGMEHATRHLIYARFWHKFLYDIGVVHDPEPFQKLYTVGIILAEDGRKMSKRWGNVINPDDMVERMGADALRVYEMFMGPFGQSIAWSTDHMVGARRFLERVYGLLDTVDAARAVDEATNLLLHQTIKKVGEDIASFNFNTAISQMMILVNALEKLESVPAYAYESLIRILAPFAPYLAEELWASLGQTGSVHTAKWPAYDLSVVASAEVTIAVQVNGKVRDTFTVAPDTCSEELLLTARARPKIEPWLAGREVVKEVVVPNRLVNFVIGG